MLGKTREQDKGQVTEVLGCFSWFIGSKEPLVISLNEDEVALCSLTSSLATYALGNTSPGCTHTPAALSRAALALTGWPAAA